MTFTPSRLLGHFLFGLLFLVATGCGVTRRPVVYYNLSQITNAEHTRLPAAGKNLALGVGPVQLPDSLNRSQIASRLDSQRLTYSDFNRWSGSLSDDFATVLMEDIAAQLPEQTPTALFPWGRYFHPTHRLIVDVSQFDGQLGGEIILAARWTLTDSDGKTPLISRKSTIRRQAPGNQHQDLVAAQSQAVADLANEIIAALANL